MPGTHTLPLDTVIQPGVEGFRCVLSLQDSQRRTPHFLQSSTQVLSSSKARKSFLDVVIPNLHLSSSWSLWPQLSSLVRESQASSNISGQTPHSERLSPPHPVPGQWEYLFLAMVEGGQRVRQDLQGREGEAGEGSRGCYHDHAV